MDTSWWLALAAVVLLSLVASVIDGWARGRRPERGRRGSRVPQSPQGAVVQPRPSEIWWAHVPRDGSRDSEGRPCLVIAVREHQVLVAEITSGQRGDRTGVIPLPPGSVAGADGHASFLNTDELREVTVDDLRRRMGEMDPALWDQVRHLAE